MVEIRQTPKFLEADQARKLLSDTHAELRNPHGRNMELVFNHLGVLSHGGILDNPTVRSYFRTLKKRGLNISTEERISVTQRLEQQLGAGYYDQFLTDTLSGQMLGIDLSEVILAGKGLAGQRNEAALASKIALRIIERNKARDGEAVVLLIAMFDQLGVQPPAPIAPLLPEFLKRYKDANNEFKKEQRRQAKLQSQPAPNPQVETSTDQAEPQQDSLADQRIGRRKFFTRAFGAGVAGVAGVSNIVRGVTTTAAGVGAGAIAAKAVDDMRSREFYQSINLSQEGPNKLLVEALRPLIDNALKERIRRSKEDPTFLHRIDADLNKDRLNFLILGVGTEKEMELTDTIMMASYSFKENKLQLISIPRDLHAPEVDGFLQQRGGATDQFHAINVAFSAGGFDLARLAVEDATGLVVDYSGKMKIEAFMDLVSATLGKVEIDVKEPLDLPPYPGNSGPGLHIPGGVQLLDANMLQEYARSRMSTGDIARSGRQQEIIEVIIQNLRKKFSSSTSAGRMNFIKRTLECLQQVTKNKKLELDSGVLVLYMANPIPVLNTVNRVFNKETTINLPESDRLVVDFQQGLDYADPERLSKRRHLLTVDGGDYKAQDLVTGYWARIRTVIEGFLTKKNGVAVNPEE